MNKILLSLVVCIIKSSFFYAQNLPKTNKAFNDSDASFQFVVVSDRTGGMQPGIFSKAMDKINLMQPEFVISVGDLIDGYTKDPDVWNSQWDEFDTIVEKLEMPFYHVPGNHDTSNELLLKAWRSRLGRDYYHFTYKDVLFLSINTDEIEGGGLSADQIEYFKQVLNDNQNVNWTLLFMHRPVWSYEEDFGYKEIEKALGNRPYTLFSGHHHHYRYKIHNNMEHFTLATSGGGSHLRGSEVGEFHHITWVTMQEEGPEIAHLELSGIYDKNVVSENDYEDIQVLRQGKWLSVSPYVHPKDTFNSLTTNMTFRNDTKRDLVIKGKLKEQYGLHFTPNYIEEVLKPNSQKDVSLQIKPRTNTGSVQQLNLKTIKINLTGGFSSTVNDSIFLTTSKDLLLDWQHNIYKATNKIAVDGQLNDWKKVSFIPVTQPQYFKEDWDWTGPEDGCYSFSVTHDSKNLYLAINFTDDVLITNADINANQDKFYLYIDAPLKPLKIELSKHNKTLSPNVNWIEGSIKKFKAANIQHAKGLTLECAIPLKALNLNKKPKTLESIKLNIGVMDHDRLENTKPSVLWWRPTKDSSLFYKESGTFILKN